MLRLWAELVAAGRGLTEHRAWGQGGEQIRGSGPAGRPRRLGDWPHQVNWGAWC